MKNEEKFWDRLSTNYDNNDKSDETYLKMLEIMKKHLNFYSKKQLKFSRKKV